MTKILMSIFQARQMLKSRGLRLGYDSLSVVPRPQRLGRKSDLYHRCYGRQCSETGNERLMRRNAEKRGIQGAECERVRLS
jgi:hypothetical protein